MKVLCASKTNAIMDLTCQEFTGLLWLSEMYEKIDPEKYKEMGTDAQHEKMMEEAVLNLQKIREIFAEKGVMNCEVSK